MPHLLGFNGTQGNFFTKLWFVLQHLPVVSLAPVLTGLLSLIGMLLLRHRTPRLPAALVVAVAARILVGLFNGEAAGVDVVGNADAVVLAAKIITEASCLVSGH